MRSIQDHNRSVWDHNVAKGNPWTLPVTSDQINSARAGNWEVHLTDRKPVPRSWFPPLKGCDVLCLASGGGQQGPTLAAAGAHVTVLDLSPQQLAQDRLVAARESLEIVTVEGDMTDLSVFADHSFDLLFHPVANNFVPDVLPIWREAYRVLRPGGVLMTGFINPQIYIFDLDALDRGEFEVKYTLPYADSDHLSEAEKAEWLKEGSPLEFSHTLDDLIGGQLNAGFVLTGFYEDTRSNAPSAPYIPTYFATRAVKL